MKALIIFTIVSVVVILFLLATIRFVAIKHNETKDAMASVMQQWERKRW